MRRTIAIAAAIVGSAIVVAPASAKSQALSPASCTPGTSGTLSYANTGSRYNIGFISAIAGGWNVKIVADDSVPLMDYTTAPGATVNVTLVTSSGFGLPKGKHTFRLDAVNLTTGGSCAAFIGPGV